MKVQSLPWQSHRLDAPEFFNASVLFAIALFAANNTWLKFTYPGWLTGKLSDFLFCFFFPLYCSALLGLIAPWLVRVRVTLGALLALGSFVAMKTLPLFSLRVTELLSSISALAGLGQSSNVVDSSDLIAIPLIAIAVIFGCARQKRSWQQGVLSK